MTFCLDIVVGALAFWWHDVTAVDRFRQLVTLFLSGALIPLAVMPAAWGPFLRVQPFGYIVAFPIQTLLAANLTGLQAELAVQAAWTFLALGAARVVWIRGLRRYSGAGA
jgi:ABC-2 type transport system permease protein